MTVTRAQPAEVVSYQVALENAVRYANEAEQCDNGGRPDDRDVRLAFAQVWAQIATASRPLH